jgi:hypothetical protein
MLKEESKERGQWLSYAMNIVLRQAAVVWIEEKKLLTPITQG